MVGLSKTTLIALNFVLSTLAPQSTPAATLDDYLNPAREHIYVVRKGDSLGSIAMEVYGNEADWTTIWNDNDWIDNPNIIFSELKLKIRTTKPPLIEELKPVLLAKNKNAAREDLGYMYHKLTYDTQNQVASISADQQSQQDSSVSSGESSGPLSEEQFTFLGNCESGMNPATNTGNGFYGAFQFTTGTWNNMNTGYERADLAPLEVQKEAVQRLLVRSSIFTQFPACSRKMQAIGLI